MAGNRLVYSADSKDAKYEIRENVARDRVCYDRIYILFSNLHAICFGTLGQRTESAPRDDEDALATKRECVKPRPESQTRFLYDEVISQSLIHSNIVKLNEDELGVLSKLSPVKGSDEAPWMI